MANQNTNKINFSSLADVKAAMKVNDAGEVSIGTTLYDFPQAILNRAIVEGLYRQLSAETAKIKDGTPEKEKEVQAILSRWISGYFTETDKRKATAPIKAASGTTSGKLTFGRSEILGAIRDLIEPDDEKTLATLKTVEALDEVKFGLFVAKYSGQDGSLVHMAIKQLTDRANEKARLELEAQLADLPEL